MHAAVDAIDQAFGTNAGQVEEPASGTGALAHYGAVMEHDVTSTRARRGQGFAVAGVVVAAWAVFIFPVVLAPIGMLLGAVAMLCGERRGRWVIALAVLGLALGLLLNALPQHFVET